MSEGPSEANGWCRKLACNSPLGAGAGLLIAGEEMVKFLPRFRSLERAVMSDADVKLDLAWRKSNALPASSYIIGEQSIENFIHGSYQTPR
jgi:hypothetical protein